eukprot:CAMPEP_0201565142 /NCGR_PEP_ID=MMETSP0190_2-20130828/4018_1 /ASSEMBLY_ACC=CAM_ASM_000263 /TAXON_ID=37353 /ORGANISM="Rosalina sp." /LENGTH=172 /DNA_ID=CAMNT_0047982263 /DNA_START=76 /DNA_END=594 /DNA_ORIENTATION=-
MGAQISNGKCCVVHPNADPIDELESVAKKEMAVKNIEEVDTETSTDEDESEDDVIKIHVNSKFNMDYYKHAQRVQQNLAKDTQNQWKRKQLKSSKIPASKPKRRQTLPKRKRKKESRFDPDYQITMERDPKKVPSVSRTDSMYDTLDMNEQIKMITPQAMDDQDVNDGIIDK